MASLVFKPEPKTARYFTEQLTDEVSLDMISVPGGEFAMGSADQDSQGHDDERPQHPVTVPSFFMGRYPITQAQWQVVAALPQVKQALKPNPSNFPGDMNPVEQVSWFDAVEFCARLSAHTGRTYRLPSEAEWEYACRAHTTTAYAFGSKLTEALANFNGIHKGTTPVDQFEYANGFGLSDMHGNVWEWCLDHWHGNYNGAPVDGSAWIDTEAEENKSRVRRGGSWDFNARDCRSAYRCFYNPRESFNAVGFRVVCVAPRTLS